MQPLSVAEAQWGVSVSVCVSGGWCAVQQCGRHSDVLMLLATLSDGDYRHWWDCWHIQWGETKWTPLMGLWRPIHWDNILFCSPSSVIRVFKSVLMNVVTDEQGFYIINRRNALENPCNYSYSLWNERAERLRIRPWILSLYYTVINT